VPRVLRAWTPPSVGVSFLLVVSTESLAVGGAVIAARERLAWLALASLAAVAAGLGAYVFVLARFDVRQLRLGRGDQWVAGGALAIATLACGDTSEAARTAGSLHALAGPLDAAALALWAAAAAWIPALLAGELAARRLGYDTERWATVFPVAMYAACSFVVGTVDGIGALLDLARVCTWVAFAFWLLVSGGLLRHAHRLWGAGSGRRAGFG
jgi:tellurite resistance protein TehA-like permease